MEELTDEQIKRLQKHEYTLSRCTFRSIQSVYIDKQTLEELGDIYVDITGVDECHGCSKDFVKRLSEWYFNAIKK